MTKKVLIIICVIQLLGIIQSCCEEEIGCFWKDFSLENIDNSDINPVISNQIRINKKAYGIRVNMIDSLLWENYANLNFTQNAKATSCAQKYIVKKIINNIQIMLLIKNSPTTGALDVTKQFKVRRASETNNKYISILEIINVLNSPNTFNESSFNSTSSSFDLYLIDNVDIRDTCYFKINLQFNDNSILSHETSPVFLY